MSIGRREFLKVSASVTATLLSGQSLAQPPYRLRKEISSLSSAEVASLSAGVSAMSALLHDNPFSWAYQRAVHSIPAATAALPDPAGVAPYWRKCKHHSIHFFDWHRWELLYWEEICRQLCGDAKFTLPYWDYFTNGFLPAAFRAPPPGGTNILYHQRDSGLNNGTSQLNTIAAGQGWPAVSPAGYGETDFFDFQTDFEGNPHDLVHGCIGFDMGSVPTAALDPIFYLHHANIDRYWASWLKQGGGRVNPGGTWAATAYDFQTVSGPKSVTSGAAGTPEVLGYTYDRRIRIEVTRLSELLKYIRDLKPWLKYLKPKIVPPRPPWPGPGPGPDPEPWLVLGALEGIALDGNPTVIRVPKDGAAAGAIRQSLAARDTDVSLVLHNVKATKAAAAGGYIYQVFLVPSEKALATDRLTNVVEVGSFSSFTVSASMHHGDHGAHGQGDAPRVAMRMNAATRRLLAGSLAGDPAFLFVRRGLVSQGKEILDKRDETLFTVEEIRVEARKRDAR